MKTAQEYYAMYLRAREVDSTRFDEYTELLAYYEMKQDQLPQNQSSKPWVINITTPYAADAVDVRIASLFSNDYVGELEPLSPDDVEDIENLNNIYHNMWKEMKMDRFVNEAIQNAAVLREAYVHFIYDDKLVGGTNRKRKGKLEPYFLDPASVLIDPNALSLRTADYLVVTERLSKRQAEELYEKYDPDYSKATGFSPMERGEIYLGKDYDTNQTEIVTKLTFYEQKDGEILKTVILENEIIAQDTLAISCFPIAQLRWKKRVKSPYGISLMDRILPLQKSINAIESASTTAALAFASPSYVVRKDSGINPKAVAALAGAPGVVFAANGDPNTAIVPVSNKSIDANLIAIRQDNQSELYRLAGVSEEFLGDFGSSGNTAGGSNAAAMRSQVIENGFLSELEEFIEDCTKIIVEFITKAFKGEKFYSRGNKRSDGKFDFTEYEVGMNLDQLEYTFGINMDVKTPYSKENIRQHMLELYQFERQYDAPVKVINVLDILKNYNVPNVQELVQRYEQLSARDSQRKAEIITQWVNISSKYGVDAGTIAQGVSEIISGEETPTIDGTLRLIQQQAMMQERQKLAAQQALAAKQNSINLAQTQEQMRAAMPKPGDETYESMGGNPVTGDETFQTE